MRPAALLLRLLLAVALLGNGLMLPAPTAQASVPERDEAGDCHGSAPKPQVPHQHASPDSDRHSMPCCDDVADPGAGCSCDCLQSSAMGVASFEFIGGHAPLAGIARRPPGYADDGPANSLLRPPIHRT